VKSFTTSALTLNRGGFFDTFIHKIRGYPNEVPLSRPLLPLVSRDNRIIFAVARALPAARPGDRAGARELRRAWSRGRIRAWARTTWRNRSALSLGGVQDQTIEQK